MPNNPELKAVLDRLTRATKGLNPDEQIAVIDSELDDPRNAKYRSYFETRKAHILGAYGHKREAAEIMKRCAAENDDSDEVQYFAGESLLETGEFTLASRCLSRSIEIAESCGDHYYLDATYLLRAYCLAKTGRFDLAQQDLTRVEDDEAMQWLEADPLVSKASIQNMMGINTIGRTKQSREGIRDNVDDPALTPSQQDLVNGLDEAALRAIDAIILKNITPNWRKVARVVSLAMLDTKGQMDGVPNMFYSQRIKLLAHTGAIESIGNLNRMGFSEVRLPQAGGSVDKD